MTLGLLSLLFFSPTNTWKQSFHQFFSEGSYWWNGISRTSWAKRRVILLQHPWNKGRERRPRTAWQAWSRWPPWDSWAPRSQRQSRVSRGFGKKFLTDLSILSAWTVLSWHSEEFANIPHLYLHPVLQCSPSTLLAKQTDGAFWQKEVSPTCHIHTWITSPYLANTLLASSEDTLDHDLLSLWTTPKSCEVFCQNNSNELIEF